MAGLMHGCGSSDAVQKISVYPVRGKVLLADGKPLSGGRVVFLPLGEPAIESSGAIAADGSFSISTSQSGEGAPQGEFRVRIDPDLGNLPAAKPGSRTHGARRLPFPPHYTDEETSGLRVTVKPEPNELPPFRLEKLGLRTVAVTRVRD